MGKEGELWDDSALIKAFDHAISKYKMMHGMSGENAITNPEKNLRAAEADNGSNEFCSSTETERVQNDGNLYTMLETNTKIGETAEFLQSKENSPLELGSSAKCVGPSNIQDVNFPATIGIPVAKSGSPREHMTSSDVKGQKEATWFSNGPEEYSKLLNTYYELEGQRQQVLQQLNQYSNWNYQHPISSTSIAEEHQASLGQPYDTVTCHCPYGCQNWVVPCNSLPASCSDGPCIDKCSHAITKGSRNRNSMSPEDPDFVKTAVVAAERALSLTKEANEGKDKQLGMDIGHFPESKSATDLDVVLNAWYSAGFYTGKYLSEQSLEKRKRDQGL